MAENDKKPPKEDKGKPDDEPTPIPQGGTPPPPEPPE